MSYKVMALRYRPQTFEEVIGQEHITKTLQNSIKNGKIAHAYLFSGIRGVGKTTTARILAKALNCVNGPTPTPCNKCQNCIEITQGKSLDTIEIDGATNRGIDQVRDIREKISFPPANSRYKIYIIDEVHMLTNESFNALLKTLEEPPPHAIFIFATTEPHKVKITIKSRCQHFNFKRVSAKRIGDYISSIAGKLGISISEKAIALIARKADGSVRDALTITEQLFAMGKDDISANDVNMLLATISLDEIMEFANAIYAGDRGYIVKYTEKLYEDGIDIMNFIEEVGSLFSNLFLISMGMDISGFDEEELVKMKALAKSFGEDAIVSILGYIDDTIKGLSKNPSAIKWLNLQLLLYHLINYKSLITPDKLIAMLEKEGFSIDDEHNKSDKILNLSSQPIEYNDGENEKPVKSDGNIDFQPIWDRSVIRIFKERTFLGNMLKEAYEVNLSGNIVEIVFAGNQRFQYNQASNIEAKTLIERVISEELGRNIVARIIINEGIRLDTKEHKEEYHDPITNNVKSVFDGEVVGVE